MAISRTPNQTSMMRSNPEVVFSLIALALAALIGFAVRYWIGLSPYWVWLVAAYSVAFALCRFDKRRAKVEGATRVPEVVLLGLMGVLVGAGYPNLCGGCLAACPYRILGPPPQSCSGPPATSAGSG